MSETTIIEWDGHALPAGLRRLPPGRYVLEPLDEMLALSPEEDAGVRAALDEMTASGGSPLAEVLERLRDRLVAK